MGVTAFLLTLVILFAIIFVVLYFLKHSLSNETIKIRKNSKNTKDKKDDDWWRKELGIDDNEKTPKKIRIQNNYSQAANENDINPTNGLISKIKRLKKLYNNGTLTKTEFEKAKNKLLK
tara:strand:+ start:175 stop:531 length:357 start_codon:yes stop_codon:yes gene_type:complete